MTEYERDETTVASTASGGMENRVELGSAARTVQCAKNTQSSARKANSNGRPTRGGQLFGALDLGTNNCRLLVARPEGRSFRVVDAFSRIVRLGEGLSANGALSDEAVDRTIAALKVCARKLRDRGVTNVRNVATQACRQASNCGDFVTRVRAETGLDLDIIAPAEEARLAVMGCQALMDRGSRRAIVFDIGGGSTELIWTTISGNGPPRILGWTSVPLGVVNLSEMYPAHDRVTPDLYREMVTMVRDRLHRFDKRYNLSKAVEKGGVQMLGTSGTVTTLTSLHMKLPRYDRSVVDGAWMQTGDLRDLSAQLAIMDYDARARFGCMGPDRAELVVAGCAILDAIFDLWPVERIRVADRGIREGMLIDLMSAHNPRRGRNGGNVSVANGNGPNGKQAVRWRRGRRPGKPRTGDDTADRGAASGNADGEPRS